MTAFCQHTDNARYILNGQVIESKTLGLIHEKNIDKIDIIKSTDPPEVRITTKKEIVFFDYDALKRWAKFRENENPPIIVDFKKIESERTIMIDKDLIRRMKVDNGKIEIRTHWYNKRRKEQGKPKIVIR
jgi:hypothetical protein